MKVYIKPSNTFLFCGAAHPSQDRMNGQGSSVKPSKISSDYESESAVPSTPFENPSQAFDYPDNIQESINLLIDKDDTHRAIVPVKSLM